MRFRSPHQWDGDNVWAPAQGMAVRGLQRYGFDAAACDIARRWVDALAAVFATHGGFFERINVTTLDLPRRKAHQYPAQQCFRSEEHTSELQSLMRTSYAAFCLNKQTLNS